MKRIVVIALLCVCSGVPAEAQTQGRVSVGVRFPSCSRLTARWDRSSGSDRSSV